MHTKEEVLKMTWVEIRAVATDCTDCTGCKDCTDCKGCKDCKDCTSCKDCTDSQYKILNVQLTQEEYKQKLQRM
jgi:hypothetical protein